MTKLLKLLKLCTFSINRFQIGELRIFVYFVIFVNQRRELFWTNCERLIVFKITNLSKWMRSYYIIWYIMKKKYWNYAILTKNGEIDSKLSQSGIDLPLNLTQVSAHNFPLKYTSRVSWHWAQFCMQTSNIVIGLASNRPMPKLMAITQNTTDNLFAIIWIFYYRNNSISTYVFL